MWRHEYKYLISDSQLFLLQNRVNALLLSDSNTLSDGSYHIRSVYFDNIYNQCVSDNENGIDPREKIRIRIYNSGADVIKLELKRKENTLCQKKTATISINELNNFLVGNRIPFDPKRPVLNYLINKIELEKYRPTVIVDYLRKPFVYKIGNVRITFDTCISSSNEFDKFLFNDIALRSVMPVGMQLLEVKFDEFLPDYIYNALQLNDLTQVAFSKYYICRKINI